MIEPGVEGSIQQLYPQREDALELKGTYLKHDLRSLAVGGVFFYANFITSLDGRIAVAQNGGGLGVPEQTSNARDWRLFQELAVQSDLVISSGRYLRDYACGEAQEILQIYDDPGLADLEGWRRSRDLKAYPDLAIVSRSLKFDLPQELLEGGRSFVVVTTESSDPQRKRELRSRAIEVLECGVDEVEGARMAAALEALGYRLIYSAAGPRIAHMLLAGGVLNRLYLTFALRLLGGAEFASIIEGGLFEPPIDLRLLSLYYDRHAPGPAGQLFAAFDVVQRQNR
jgi:riboflavin biosynthesis pyrimidine reductase